ncbi:hypothetical protein Tco_1421722 [Tanacetum coccineum]
MNMINMSIVNNSQEPDNNEHDVFYAELEKQVLALLDDHDQKEFPSDTRKHSSSSPTTRRLDIAKRPTNYFYWNDNVDDPVPIWISNLWGNNNNKGTGVFIPSVVNSRRKNYPRRRNNNKGIRTRLLQLS